MEVAKREYKGLVRNWNHLTVMASWIHNSRVSSLTRSIPWSMTYVNPMRSDLFPFQIVTVVNSTRLTSKKATARIFIGLKSPTEAVVWSPRNEKDVQVVHPSQLRVIKPSIEFILSHFGADDESLASLGSLAASSAKLPRNFRKDPRWSPAV